jgi:hypothetical protein
VRLFGGQILPPAMFRRSQPIGCWLNPRYFWLRSESASAASTHRRCDSRSYCWSGASYCWSWASIAARPPDLAEAHSVDLCVYCPCFGGP